MRHKRIVPWIAIVLAVAALGLTTAATSYLLTHVGQPASNVVLLTGSLQPDNTYIWNRINPDGSLSDPVPNPTTSGQLFMITDFSWRKEADVSGEYLRGQIFMVGPQGTRSLCALWPLGPAKLTRPRGGSWIGELNMTTGFIVSDPQKIDNFCIYTYIDPEGIEQIVSTKMDFVKIRGYLVPNK